MADRPISLDLRTPSGQGQGDRSGGTAGGLPQKAPDNAAVARFAQSMRGSGDAAAPAAASRSEPPAAPDLSGPLGLFGAAGSRSAEHATAIAAPATQKLVSDLQDSVKRLLVAEDQRSLRLDIDPSVFPGVVVRVFEDAGAWVAEFSCSDIESFNKLARPAQDMASRLAESLSRDAVWKVLPQGLEGLGATGPVEAFASAPGGMR